ncbi:MAG: tRNA 5-methoxyuridine(34)/uridine 5-oxyacetic acid(34) synthase CmoB [Campylobacteraceae bacterium]|nr:tRNA 5-methoxyuridine(34)/uridine 5-oxyacetic acid(34) synthase CmoB [Campylobacteraceae bacterium]
MNKKLEAKNIKPLYERLAGMPEYPSVVSFGDCISVDTGYGFDENSEIYAIARALMPWRKGPFRIDNFEIVSEWNSYIKFNILAPYINIEDKSVIDIGCNNGYYSFKMLPFNPKKIIAIDPWPIFYLQFLFMNKFIGSDKIEFRLIGMEDMTSEGIKGDVVFCLGVLYHRTDPIAALKEIKACMNDGGELFIDNLVIMKEGYYALCPPVSYAKMSNAYFIPTVDTMRSWLERAGFKHIELIDVKKTELTEQRKTDWIEGLSLDSFLDPNDDSKTIEGFDAPVRAYFRCRRVDGKR